MRRWLLVSMMLAAAPLAQADEGMWTYNNFPSAVVGQKYGFTPGAAWLDHARQASVRLAEGCSGSIVSPEGLVMTNHHCAHACIQQLSTAQRDYVQTGFYAKTAADEVRCPTMEVNQLTEIRDVTARVNQATQGLTGQKYVEAQKAIFSTIEHECAQSDQVRCDVVTLYRGGQYNLYKYRRFQDVRLVFAPEFAIAFFGGDPDNFNFPRYDLDVTFVRIYDHGQPAKLDTYFPWSPNGAKEGELEFISGHPGSTARLDTVAELEYERDVYLPLQVELLGELRGVLEEFSAQSAESARRADSLLFHTENSLKVQRGRHQALTDAQFMQQKRAAEQALQAKVAGSAQAAQFKGAWEQIAQAQAQLRNMHRRLYFLEGASPEKRRPQGFTSQLFTYARELVRAADELPKPNPQRLREFTDARLPQLKQELASTEPIYDDLETERLTWSLTKLREFLGADDPLVHKFLGSKSPRQLATELIRGSADLKDPQKRLALLQGGKKAVDASSIPLLRFAKLVDPDSRAVRKSYEEQVQSVVDRNHELIARAQFQAYGTSVYPDATFTLRLSYGTVKGWQEEGKPVAPITTIGGAFNRATGAPPFALPDSWLKAKGKLNLNAPMDLCTDNDIIGGNSGSPLFNKNLEITGLVFDGNIHSIGGDYGFDEKDNRAVSVSSVALLEALGKVYGAQRIVDEIRNAPPPKI